jgi:phosphatidate cytidylyltransferase
MMSQLRQRVLTAVPLLAGLLLLLFAAPVWLVIAASTVLIALGAWEWSAFVGWQSSWARGGYVAGFALVMAEVGWLVQAGIGLSVVLWIALLWWAVAFFWILRYPTRVPPVIAIFAGLLVLVPAWLSMIAILKVPQRGPQLLLLALCIVFAADIGAYFAGHRFGRLKLALRVSPGKTWEGFIGGVLFAGLVAAAGGAILGLPMSFMGPIGLGIAALSVVGDLTESMFKRSVGLKDSGQLIPGHGGVLDRLDSVAPALPVFALALSWLGVIPG